jgi:hypothetical protein
MSMGQVLCLPDSHVAIISQRHLPIAEPEFTKNMS